MLARLRSKIPFLAPPAAADPNRIRRGWEALHRSMHSRAKVVMLGDSLTAGGPWSEIFGSLDVLNRGVGGSTTAHILGRLDETIERNPARVFLMIGINDLLAGASALDTAARVAQIVQRLQREKIEVFLQSVLPTADNIALNQQVATLNRETRDCATYIDLWPAFAPSGALLPEMTSDGLHLIGTAYLVWAEAIRLPVSQALRLS